jgi:uncharacterized protein
LRAFVAATARYMGSMKCPRCESAMTELDRDGITIDRCERCRGVWLDRGELEKLLARRSDDAPPPDRGRRDDEDDDGDDDDRRGRGGGRRWWEIFD